MARLRLLGTHEEVYVSVVLVGISYRCAPIELLEKAAIAPQDRTTVARDLLTESFISEVFLLSTCNRTEFYVVCEGFHPTVEKIVDTLAHNAGVSVSELLPHLYVRYAEAAAEHMLRVAAGLDSMVTGEQQIIGQLRDAYTEASEAGTCGSTLHDLVQRALRTGKRVHAETEIDGEGPSMVSFAMQQALESMGTDTLDHAHALVIGAGAMASLAATHLGKLGAHLTIANRTFDRADTLADHAHQAGVDAQAIPFDQFEDMLPEVDIVVSATGALEPIITTDMVTPALSAGKKLVIIDLSLPRDVACTPAENLTLINIAQLKEAARDTAQGSSDASSKARQIVADELRQYVTHEREVDVVPTVKALRSHAASIVAAEIERIDQKLPELDEKQREEVHRAMQRVVDKLMHTPTVRLKQMAGQTDVSYSSAVRTLFELPAGTVSGLYAPANYSSTVHTEKEPTL